jgi:hypothetical protein
VGPGVELHLMEVNANPDIAPDAGLAAALDVPGIPYGEFVRALLLDALRDRAGRRSVGYGNPGAGPPANLRCGRR